MTSRACKRPRDYSLGEVPVCHVFIDCDSPQISNTVSLCEMSAVMTIWASCDLKRMVVCVFIQLVIERSVQQITIEDENRQLYSE